MGEATSMLAREVAYEREERAAGVDQAIESRDERMCATTQRIIFRIPLDLTTATA